MEPAPAELQDQILSNAKAFTQPAPKDEEIKCDEVLRMDLEDSDLDIVDGLVALGGQPAEEPDPAAAKRKFAEQIQALGTDNIDDIVRAMD